MVEQGSRRCLVLGGRVVSRAAVQQGSVGDVRPHVSVARSMASEACEGLNELELDWNNAAKLLDND